MEDRVIKFIEFCFGNCFIVYYVLLVVDDIGEVCVMDEVILEYGYVGFGGWGVEILDEYLGYVLGVCLNIYLVGIG